MDEVAFLNVKGEINRQPCVCERALLARQFADATESYRCLVPVVGARH